MKDVAKVKEELAGVLADMRHRIAELEAAAAVYKKTEEELRALKWAVEHMQIGVTISNGRGQIIYTNPAEARIHGYQVDELIGRDARCFAPPETWRPLTRDRMKEVQSLRRETVNVRKDGTRFPVRLLSDVLTDSGGEPIGMVTTCEDITERKRVEEELQLAHEELERRVQSRTAELSKTIAVLKEQIAERKRAEDAMQRMQSQLLQAQKMEAVGTLAGGVAHDFNNLLTAIQGHLEMAMLRIQESDPLYRDLKKTRLSATRAADLTRKLLLFSRRQPMEFTSVSINKTIENFMRILDRLIGEDIAVETRLAPDIWPLWADEGTIEQVIMNLVLNARDAMPEGGKITIETKNATLTEEDCADTSEARPGRFVRLAVADTGVGMGQSVLSHIFEPFFTTKEAGKGTGLGLSVVYGIVKQHGGWVCVLTAPGAGSEFVVYIPSLHAKPAEAPEEVTSLEGLQGNGECVLLVEDEAGVLEVAGRALRENGYTVLEATSFAEAVDMYRAQDKQIKLLFSDVVLPDKSGVQLADELLSMNRRLKVLLTSGYTEQRSQARQIRDRGIRFLPKPYSLTDLLRTVKEIVESGGEPASEPASA
ncbi:MAG: ATP-binding protein [Acidobacteriota bacterium]